MKSFFNVFLIATILTLPGQTRGGEQYTEKLLAIHYSEAANKADSTFEYDPHGNVTLRSTANWREENAYDSQNRRIARSVYSMYGDEMRLKTEQEWDFDSHGNECMRMEKDYSIFSGELRSSELKRRSYDDTDRLLSEVNCRYYGGAWWPDDSLSCTYDDEQHRWLRFEQNSNGARTLYEHLYDEAGNDTLINKYLSNIYKEEWVLTARTLLSYCEYGETCELIQGLHDGIWVDSQKTETEYHHSADSYRKTKWFCFPDLDPSYPTSDEWEYAGYEYNYHATENYLHIWGNDEDRSFEEEWRYDDLGRVIWYRTMATSHSHETNAYEYDLWGNLVQTTCKDSSFGDLESQTSYVYTYDDNGAILASEYWYKDYLDYTPTLRQTKVFEFDPSVPASAVLHCPSPYYKLLRVTETRPHDGKSFVTTYEYGPAEGIESIQAMTDDQQTPAIYYDLMGRRLTKPHGIVVKRK